jgi:Cu2+-exporting ATPase
VVSNALRLNLVNIRRADRDRKIRQNKINKTRKEDTVMEKTLKIEGMMCPHCEARVKKTLEALPEVESALVSHESGTAVLTLKEDISDAKLKEIIEDAGYTVI